MGLGNEPEMQRLVQVAASAVDGPTWGQMVEGVFEGLLVFGPGGPLDRRQGVKEALAEVFGRAEMGGPGGTELFVIEVAIQQRHGGGRQAIGESLQDASQERAVDQAQDGGVGEEGKFRCHGYPC